MPKALANRKRHQELLQSLGDHSITAIFTNLEFQMQKIVSSFENRSESERPDVYHEAKTILALLPLLVRCPDKGRVYSGCLDKMNKTVLESHLSEDWINIADEREISARKQAWNEFAPHYDRFVAALQGPISRIGLS